MSRGVVVLVNRVYQQKALVMGNDVLDHCFSAVVSAQVEDVPLELKALGVELRRSFLLTKFWGFAFLG
jgi:hypothetical protein